MRYCFMLLKLIPLPSPPLSNYLTTFTSDSASYHDESSLLNLLHQLDRSDLAFILTVALLLWWFVGTRCATLMSYKNHILDLSLIASPSIFPFAIEYRGQPRG